MYSRLVAAKDFKNMFASIPSKSHVVVIEEVLHVGEKRRRGASAHHVAARQNADDDTKQLPSSKL